MTELGVGFAHCQRSWPPQCRPNGVDEAVSQLPEDRRTSGMGLEAYHADEGGELGREDGVSVGHYGGCLVGSMGAFRAFKETVRLIGSNSDVWKGRRRNR